MIQSEEGIAEDEREAEVIRNGRELGALAAVLNWKQRIILFVAATTLVSIVVSLLLPKWYLSTTSLLSPKNQGGASIGGLSTLLKEVAPSPAGGLLGDQSGTYSYLAILNSRRAAEAMIHKFGLAQEYGMEDSPMEKIIDRFRDNLDLEVTEEGALVVNVYDKDAQRAADMANHMVDLVNEISIELGTGEGRSTREFLETRLNQNREDLRRAEDTLQHYQERHGIVVFSEDAAALANSIGEFYGRKVRAEIELSILEKSVGTENPTYKQIDIERNEIAKKLSGIPSVGIETFRLYREVVIQQKILEFITPMYEQARIDEKKDTPVILVLDKAVPSEEKARPKRALIVVSAFLSSLICSIAFVLLLQRLHLFRDERPDLYRVLMSLFSIRRNRGS